MSGRKTKKKIQKENKGTEKKQQQNRWLKALTYSPVGKWAEAWGVAMWEGGR